MHYLSPAEAFLVVVTLGTAVTGGSISKPPTTRACFTTPGALNLGDVVSQM
jgi:hypothetical protein